MKYRHYAIADYFKLQGYDETLESFMKDCNMVLRKPKQVAMDMMFFFLIQREGGANNPKYNGLLEKKWTSVIRLQRKVMDLEQKLSEMQKEVVEGGATRKTRLATDWIPRPPER